MQKPGFTFSETLIVGALFALFILAGTLVLSMERSRTRDAIRIADMTRVAAAFAVMHAQQASYAAAATGCDQVGDQVADCAFIDVVNGLGQLKDPGRFSYTVATVPDRDGYAIAFKLERGYGILKSGSHTLTQNGIQ